MSNAEKLTDQVIQCAEMDMSQTEIADFLRVTPGTISRITSKLNIKLKRKRRCLLYTSPSPRDGLLSRMPSSA